MNRHIRRALLLARALLLPAATAQAGGIDGCGGRSL
jgi:hypothetical protein